jgi:hypothetical protein
LENREAGGIIVSPFSLYFTDRKQYQGAIALRDERVKGGGNEISFLLQVYKTNE